jgi:O-succinylbenzoate synthase
LGYGEAAPIPWFGTETTDEAEAAARELGSRIELDYLGRIPPKLACLRHALASALAPIRTEPPKHPTLGVAALLPAGLDALVSAEIKGEAGFRIFKWKVGVQEADKELGWLDELCSVLPKGAKLRLDANGAWDRRRAERWLERCSERPVEFVEQPVPPEAGDLLRGLADNFPVPIGLDESIACDADIERWIGAGWRGVYVVKPTLLADADDSLARLAKARARVVFSSALESSVAARSALEAAFFWNGEPLALGFGVWPLYEDPRFDGPAALPFLSWDEVARMNPEAAWNAAI